MKRRDLSLLMMAAPLLLAGCATSHQGSLFLRTGRFVLVFPTDDGRSKSVSGRFSLRKTAESTTLDLMTPLNGILARITTTPSGATMTTTREDSTVTADSAEALMHKTLGFSLPIEVMEGWLSTRQTHVNTLGWKVVILQRTPAGDPSVLRATSVNPPLKLTLSMDH